jgi:cystathionine beta-lyase family protein involved in aluminum resistance
MPLIEVLQNKYFKCKIQKDKKEWIPTKVYFSLDQHVLLFDSEHKKLIQKVNSKGVKGNKVTENMLELVGKEEGIIFDSTRKQLLHFTTMDELDEFIFYVENIMQENNPQEK